VGDYRQYFQLQPAEELSRQGARCMDCGIPFCHEGCPLGNLIPEWNDLVYRDKWREASEQLHMTNNFPEFTGRICPAPCESACVLAINDEPVTIEQIEMAIAERAFDEGWIIPEPPDRRTGKTVAVVGSGPAGLAAAAELNKSGHAVTVYERDEGPGGLMRFGVPDAKLEKRIIDRRAAILEQEGIEFVYNTDVGRDIDAAELVARHDAVVVTIGSRVSRDLDAPGPQPRRDPLRHGLPVPAQPLGRRAGGPAVQAGRARPRDRCQGQEGDRDRRRRHRDGLHLQLPPGGCAQRDHARRLCGAAGGRPRSAASVAAASETDGDHVRARRGRDPPVGGTEVTGFGGKGGRVSHVYARQVTGTSSRDLTPVPGSEFVLEADLALIAIGFEHPEHEGLVAQLGLELDRRGNISTRQTYRTSANDVYACGDARLGQSLIVTAIAEGRKCARIVNKDLGGSRWTPTARCSRSARGAARPTARCGTRPRPPGPCGRARSSSRARGRGRSEGRAVAGRWALAGAQGGRAGAGRQAGANAARRGQGAANRNKNARSGHFRCAPAAARRGTQQTGP